MIKKKILVLTDNTLISRRFENEVWSLVDAEIYDITYKCSPYSDPNEFKLSNEVKTINLKNKDCIKHLLVYDLIISIHSKQLFPKELIDNVRCVNIHPGYNPVNRGWYPQVFAIINDTEIGVTIHEIDEKLDHGNIIARSLVNKQIHDTSLSLYNKLVDMEIELSKSYINNILLNDYKSFRPENPGNLYLKKDFKKLCKLDMDARITMKEAINYLRALSHGKYQNAYFYDKNGKKVYVSINLKHESEN